MSRREFSGALRCPRRVASLVRAAGLVLAVCCGLSIIIYNTIPGFCQVGCWLGLCFFGSMAKIENPGRAGLCASPGLCAAGMFGVMG